MPVGVAVGVTDAVSDPEIVEEDDGNTLSRAELLSDCAGVLLDDMLGLEPEESEAVGEAESVPLLVVVEVRVEVRVGVSVLDVELVFEGVGVVVGELL